jgi:hypothetical protein
VGAVRARARSGDLTDRLCAAEGFTPRAAVRSVQIAGVAALAAAGLGPALVPSKIVVGPLRASVRSLDPPRARELCALTRSAWSPLACAFLDEIAQDPWRRREPAMVPSPDHARDAAPRRAELLAGLRYPLGHSGPGLGSPGARVVGAPSPRRCPRRPAAPRVTTLAEHGLAVCDPLDPRQDSGPGWARQRRAARADHGPVAADAVADGGYARTPRVRLSR